MRRKIVVMLILTVILTTVSYTTVYADLFDDQAQVEADAGMTWDEIMEMSQQSSSGLTSLQGLILWMFAMLAFLKLAQKMDGMLQSLGLNVSQTGGRVASDLLMAGFAISKIGGMASRLTGRAGAGAGAGAATGNSGSNPTNSASPGRSSNRAGQSPGRPHVPSSPISGRAAPGRTAPAPTGGRASRSSVHGSSSDGSHDTTHTPFDTASPDSTSARVRTPETTGRSGRVPAAEEDSAPSFAQGLKKAVINKGAIGAGVYVGKSAYGKIADSITRRREDSLADRAASSGEKPLKDTSSLPPMPVQAPVKQDDWKPSKPLDSATAQPLETPLASPDKIDWIPSQPADPLSSAPTNTDTKDDTPNNVPDESSWTPAEPSPHTYDHFSDTTIIPSHPDSTEVDSTSSTGDDWTPARASVSEDDISVPISAAAIQTTHHSDVTPSSQPEGVIYNSEGNLTISSDNRPTTPIASSSPPINQPEQSVSNVASTGVPKTDTTPMQSNVAPVQPPPVTTSQPPRTSPPPISAAPPSTPQQSNAIKPPTPVIQLPNITQPPNTTLPSPSAQLGGSEWTPARPAQDTPIAAPHNEVAKHQPNTAGNQSQETRAIRRRSRKKK